MGGRGPPGSHPDNQLDALSITQYSVELDRHELGAACAVAGLEHARLDVVEHLGMQRVALFEQTVVAAHEPAEALRGARVGVLELRDVLDFVVHALELGVKRAQFS